MWSTIILKSVRHCDNPYRRVASLNNVHSISRQLTLILMETMTKSYMKICNICTIFIKWRLLEYMKLTKILINKINKKNISIFGIFNHNKCVQMFRFMYLSVYQLCLWKYLTKSFQVKGLFAVLRPWDILA